MGWRGRGGDSEPPANTFRAWGSPRSAALAVVRRKRSRNYCGSIVRWQRRYREIGKKRKKERERLFPCKRSRRFFYRTGRRHSMLNVTLQTRRQIPKRHLFTTAAIPLLQLALSLGMPRGAAAFSDQQAAMLPAGLSTTLTALNPPQPHPALAKGKFLVASRRLGDPNFVETVILLLAYDEKGTIGVVINRPTEARLSTLLSEVKELQKRTDVVYLGGPVGRSQMLILARSNGQVEQSLRVFEDVYTVAGQRMLEQLIHEVGAQAKFRAYLGYAGWGAGQLDFE